MNQFDSYKLQKKTYFEPVKLIDQSSFHQFKSISANNLKTHNETSTNSPTPLFIKAPFKTNNKIQIRFLKDTDTVTHAQQTRISLYGSLVKANTYIRPTNEFASYSHENFATSSHKIFNRTHADNSLKRFHLQNLQSKPSSATLHNNSLKLKITNVTIKQNTIDMSEQLSMIPEVTESSYILNEKAKLIAKLMEKSSNLKIDNQEDHNRLKSGKKKPPEASNSKLALCHLKSLDLNLDLEKNLKLADDNNSDQYFNNNFTVSYPTLNSNFFGTQKFNTKLDRQFKRITTSTDRNKKNASTVSTASSRAKSSTKTLRDESNVIYHFKEAKKSNAERLSMTTSEIKGTSIKLISNNKNNFDNNYCTTSLIDFT